MRSIVIGSGVILVGTGIWCLAHPGVAFLSLAFILGIAMLISGVSNIISFCLDKERDYNIRWQLAEGILSTILAIMVLSNLLITEAMIVLFFGMWILFSGVLRIVASFIIKNLGIPGWYWGFIFGIISILVAVYSFINPYVAGLAMIMIIGIIFTVQGANAIVIGVQMKKRDSV